ncbi:hypothetical protein ABH935_001826 [Catenulispora sp. GAS73]
MIGAASAVNTALIRPPAGALATAKPTAAPASISKSAGILKSGSPS